MEINKKIEQAIQTLQSMRIAQKYLDKVEEKMAKLEYKIQDLKELIEGEHKDVEFREKTSANFIFRAILGDKTEQLEMERQEYLHAVLTYKDHCKELELLQFEWDVLQEKIARIPKQKALVASLIHDREKELAVSMPNYYSRILQIFNQLDEASKFQTEIEEADHAGNKCKSIVEKVIKALNYAAEMRNWGSNKKNSDYSKEKSAVDEAWELFQKLKVELLKFEDELHDIHAPDKIEMHEHETKFDSFIDVYHNHLINDWIIRNRISSTISMMEAIDDEITRLLHTISVKAKQSDIRIDYLSQQKRELIAKEIN